MIRVGIDVGGTNTDAVVMKNDEFLGGEKSPSTPDVYTGVELAVRGALARASINANQVDAVMLGTTHFVNALVERKRLANCGLIRMCLPSGSSLFPFADWPNELVEAINGTFHLVNGGYEMDGTEIAPLNEEQLLKAADELFEKGCRQIAISSVFATVRNDMEHEAKKLLQKKRPKIDVSLSCDIGRMGLLERENAAIINASLKPLAKEVVEAFQKLQGSVGFDCPLFFTRNDGTLIDASEVLRLPVLTFACGPTNSMRGAAYLSGIKDALVVDIGGTTTDVGEVINGFPRLAGTSVTVADVRTNFSMPDVLSIGLGGGSRIRPEQPLAIGPESVGHELLQRAYIFGGDVLTASDLAVSIGRAKMGTHAAPEIENADELKQLLDQIISDAVARTRTSDKQMPVIAVGGGSVLLGAQVDGLEVIRPPHHDLANAVGAAIAQISGEVSKVVSLSEELDRETAIAQITQEANEVAISRGADITSLSMLSLSDVPLSYLPGNNLAISVTVVGDLKMEQRK
ncbi:MAG: hydantoinase/oxoprolinase family protein [Rhizobiaceae bacterium]|nr:hydantoinase/oxoprolinase family protein [Rhizobiaceae bacterium]